MAVIKPGASITILVAGRIIVHAVVEAPRQRRAHDRGFARGCCRRAARRQQQPPDEEARGSSPDAAPRGALFPGTTTHVVFVVR